MTRTIDDIEANIALVRKLIADVCLCSNPAAGASVLCDMHDSLLAERAEWEDAERKADEAAYYDQFNGEPSGFALRSSSMEVA